MYADDIKIYGIYDDENYLEVRTALQTSLAKMLGWASKWDLRINYDKSLVMHVGVKDKECRTKLHQSGSIHVEVRTRRKLRSTTRSTYNSVWVARSTSDFNKKKRQRRKFRQLQQDRDKKLTSRWKDHEKAWEDKNPRQGYASLEQYSGKMKRRSQVLNTTNEVAVGEPTLPIRKNHFKTLQAPSVSRTRYVDRRTYAVNEEPSTESEILVCIRRTKNGESGGDDGSSAEMLKYLPPSGIREMTNIIRSIWIDERILDSWRHAITIPLHKKLYVTDPGNYRVNSLLHAV
ncbi:hypothetical protein RB195_024328 [Necator americanus]|uniref:Reverse transcriptase domain-containing protein n=1 Tax=Necator americanus TaxID=51031 RepID=A0ABR1EQ16_NECAM